MLDAGGGPRSSRISGPQRPGESAPSNRGSPRRRRTCRSEQSHAPLSAAARYPCHTLRCAPYASRKASQRGNDLSVGLVGPITLNALIAHILGREVRVAPRSVPVSAARLRVERHGNLEVLADTLHDVARHPHVVTAVDTSAWPDLVLPLPRHDFRVGAGDPESSPQALLVVGLRNDPAEGNSVSAAAVVRALGASGLTVVRKAERNFLSGLEERVLLLNPEPRNLIFRFRHDLQASSALVALHWKLRLRVESLTPDQLVRMPTERIVEDSNRLDENFRIGPRGLFRRGAVIVPDRQFGRVGRHFIDRLRLGPNVKPAEVLRLTPTEPAVLKADLTTVGLRHREKSC